MDFSVFSALAPQWWKLAAAAIFAYLLGSISFSIIITKLVTKKEDIRTMGSGNAGFTNVLRSVGKGPAVFTIVFDFLKGVLSVFIGGLIMSTIMVDNQPSAELISYGKYLCGICCMAGHIYPVYFGFKGGKGVVTAAALILMVDWRVFLVVISAFLIVFLITKIISISSIISAVVFPAATFGFTFFADYLGKGGFSVTYVVIDTAFALGIGVFVIAKHKQNIIRLLNGTEKKITAKK